MSGSPELSLPQKTARNASPHIGTKGGPEKLNLDEIKLMFHYDPLTGVFSNRNKVLSSGKCRPVGSRSQSGYTVISIKGVKVFAHKLAWLYHYGELPNTEIDHINRKKWDNRIVNLRLATRSINSRNTSVQCNSATGVIGLYVTTKLVKGVKIPAIGAQIKIDNKKFYLGTFTDFLEAAAHRFAAEQCVGWVNEADPPSSAQEVLVKYLASLQP